MRTTLDIEEDVLQAAKGLAAKEKSTAGAVISRLARQGLLSAGRSTESSAPKIRNGIPVFPMREDEIMTMDHIQRLLDEEGL